jgi:hypothetical protein
MVRKFTIPTEDVAGFWKDSARVEMGQRVTRVDEVGEWAGRVRG